jgi:uncharacterized protein YacL
MINYILSNMKKAYLLLIVASFFTLVGCSYGVDSYFRIIPPNGMTPIDTFHRLDEIVSAQSALILESKCDESHIHYLNKYRMTSNKAIYVELILNTENGVLALGYSQLGVNEFTTDANDFFSKLSVSFEKQFGVERLVAIEKDDKGSFIKLLKGDEKKLHLCE